MQIKSIRIIRVKLPLTYPFRTSFGDFKEIESVLVRLTSFENLTGWGESASWSTPSYSAEYAGTQFMISKDIIAPMLIRKSIQSGDDLQKLLIDIKGNHFAKAAFDLAWWDLFSREQKKPLWQVIGGVKNNVEAGADFGVMDNVSDLLEQISMSLDNGYGRIKLKFRPGWDLVMLNKVRKKFPNAKFHIDCNSIYSLKDLDMLKELDSYNLEMIEQPLAHDDLIDHAELQNYLKTPICLDESIVSVDKARKAIQLGACKWINIKLGRVGGITHALKIIQLSEENNIPCWVGGMLESAIGGYHNISFATLSNIKYPSDLFPTTRFYKNDITSIPIEHSEKGHFKPIDADGIGIIPNEKVLNKYILEEFYLN